MHSLPQSDDDENDLNDELEDDTEGADPSDYGADFDPFADKADRLHHLSIRTAARQFADPDTL